MSVELIKVDDGVLVIVEGMGRRMLADKREMLPSLSINKEELA